MSKLTCTNYFYIIKSGSMAALFLYPILDKNSF